MMLLNKYNERDTTNMFRCTDNQIMLVYMCCGQSV